MKLVGGLTNWIVILIFKVAGYRPEDRIMWSINLKNLKLVLMYHLMQKGAVHSSPVSKYLVTDTDGNFFCVEWCFISIRPVIDFTIILVCSMYKEGRFCQSPTEIRTIKFVPHTTKMINPFHIQSQFARYGL